jgi:hypothetical protein
LDQIKFNQILAQAEELGRIFGGLRASVGKQRKQRGVKLMESRKE